MSGKQGEWCMIGVYGGVCEGECVGYPLGDEPSIFTRSPICELLQLYEALEGWKSECGQAHNLRV